MSGRLVVGAVAAGSLSLVGGLSVACAGDYNAKESAWAAQNWAVQASALAPEVPDRAAENPQGPTVIASRPVPDTARNRARFGEPMSRAGKATAPIGD